MVGIVLEQHPDRTRLFMQWRRMDFPLMVDPFNLLGLPFVPATFLLDEHGVIQLSQPKLDKLPQIEDAFFNRSFDPPADTPSVQTRVPDLAQIHQAAQSGGARDWRDYATELTLWGGAERLDEAIEAAQQALNLRADDTTHFRLGVIYRKRYDSPYRQDNDFRRAVEHWSKALDIDPNNYIWRRRIQQYGPRLDKPYPFYDWVPIAREEVAARGETPIELSVEPGGAEFAQPAQDFGAVDGQHKEPDAEGRIFPDEEPFIHIETILVPPAIVSGDTARVHVTLRPNLDIKAHWNNEAGDTALWINLPEKWNVERRYLTVPNPTTDVSLEARHFEFEVRVPQDAVPGPASLSAYALYYVCEDVNGVCMYRRQNIPLNIQIKAVDGLRLRDGG